MTAKSHDSLGALFFTGCVERRPKHCRQFHQTQKGPTTTLAFQIATFLLKFLVPGLNGYLAGWIHVKLYAKCTLLSCYKLILL